MIAVVSVVSVLAVVVFSHLLDRNEKSGEEATMTSLNETPSDRFIITYTEGSRASQAINSAQTYGTNVLDTLPAEDRDAINRAASTVSATVEGVSAHSLSTVGVDLDVELTSEQVGQFVAAFGGDTGVEAVEPELHMTLLGENAPNDEYYSYQWDMASDGYGVDAEDAWSHSTGKGVTVAVVDTGVLTDHPDLRDQVVPGYDFISDPSRSHDGDGRDADPYDAGDNVVAEECGAGSPATDSSWHGSHVAGTIAASTNNSTGVSGVAPDAKVLPVRVLGSCGGTGTDIIDALTWASGGHVNGVPDNENPAQVINMSLGGPGFCPVYYQRAIDAAVERGSVVVVAAERRRRRLHGRPRQLLQRHHRGCLRRLGDTVLLLQLRLHRHGVRSRWRSRRRRHRLDGRRLADEPRGPHLRHHGRHQSGHPARGRHDRPAPGPRPRAQDPGPRLPAPGHLDIHEQLRPRLLRRRYHQQRGSGERAGRQDPGRPRTRAESGAEPRSDARAGEGFPGPSPGPRQGRGRVDREVGAPARTEGGEHMSDNETIERGTPPEEGPTAGSHDSEEPTTDGTDAGPAGLGAVVIMALTASAAVAALGASVPREGAVAEPVVETTAEQTTAPQDGGSAATGPTASAGPTASGTPASPGTVGSGGVVLVLDGPMSDLLAADDVDPVMAALTGPVEDAAGACGTSVESIDVAAGGLLVHLADPSLDQCLIDGILGGDHVVSAERDLVAGPRS